MTQFQFFSGKGGVGKTSLAAATAVHHADRGERTLIVTTDPASNLADVFAQEIGPTIRPIQAVPGLDALEIDAAQAAREYRDRVLEPLRAILPPAVLDVVAEQLNSPCTDEIASFDRFIACMEQPGYDVVVFDTAPTGHTLRMLELPVDWSRHIGEAEQGSGQTCLGPVSLLQGARQRYDQAIAAMRDAERTRFILVSQPEATPIGEIRRARQELAQIGIPAAELIINGVLPPEAGDDPFVARRRALQASYISKAAGQVGLPICQVPLLPIEVRGVEGLRQLGRVVYEGAGLSGLQPGIRGAEVTLDLERARVEVRERLAPGQGQRIVLVAGKGGVGKTSVAAAMGIWSADAGRRTLVVTTDPAAHLAQVFEQPVGTAPGPVEGVPNLWAARIDPKAALAAYKARLLADARTTYAADMLKVLEEQLDSPCTEEMAAFNEFLTYLVGTESQWDVVMFDTAPTGHTMRLLGLPINWEKQMAAHGQEDETRRRYQAAIAKLRNPALTTVGFVVYPEATPILEAGRASRELADLGIPTGFVIANMVLTAETAASPYFAARRAMQQEHLRELPDGFDAPVLQLPLIDRELLGVPVLRDMAGRLLGKEGVTV
jgi:arsenite/tail-anchored protein-transporting ATPase